MIAIKTNASTLIFSERYFLSKLSSHAMLRSRDQFFAKTRNKNSMSQIADISVDEFREYRDILQTTSRKIVQ